MYKISRVEYDRITIREQPHKRIKKNKIMSIVQILKTRIH